MEHTALEGTVFNIERGSNEDGPGIRTVVFLKGCGLRCKWCANPESQLAAPEIMHIGNVCVQCGQCVETCPQGAISRREGYGYITDRAKCTLCLACVRGCYINARKLQGMKYTVDALVQEVLKDKAFFLRSGGGVTFSGGEPFCQPEALLPLARGAREQGKDVTIYSGYTLEQLLEMAKDHPAILDLLRACDILVDGPYVEQLRDLTLTFRGSSNQRILVLKEVLPPQ